MSGRLVLASKGTQDLWISEEPTYSHFLFALKKHTKFAFDTLEFPLLEPKFEQETICYIPMDAGDLLTRLSIRYTINHTTSSGERIFTPFAGIHLIEYADLFIGGVKIERLTGDWIYLYHKFNSDRSTFINTIKDLTSVNGTNVLHVDLPFYFYDNTKVSVLCCKLQKQNCYVKIKFKKWEDVVHGRFQSTVSDINIQNASLLARYCYLDNGELQYLKSTPIDQIITQTQLRRFDISRGETKRVRLNFKNPVKTLYFFVYNKNNTLIIQDYNSETGDYHMMNAEFSRAKLLINNQSVFDEDYKTLVHKNYLVNSIADHETFVPYRTTYADDGQKLEKLEVGTYSFAAYPLRDEPSGHLNFSRIIHQEFEMEIPENDLRTYSSYVNGYISGITNLPVITVEDTFYNDFIGNENECKIYAVSYNVLTYNSGLCGLRF